MSEGLFKKIGSVVNVFNKNTSSMNKVMDKVVPTETRDNLNWKEEADLVMIEQSPIKAKRLLYTVLIVLIVLILWANFAEVDELVRGQARVVPSKHVQVIQSLDGGIVSKIFVRAGDAVKIGQSLIQVDPTRANSSLEENRGQYLALLAKDARLRALANDREFSPPEEVEKELPQAYSQELALYNASQAELNSAVSIARDQVVQRERELTEVRAKKDYAERNYESANQELAANKPLLASGAVSDIDILRLERDATRARGDIAQASAQMSRIQAAISEANRKVSETKQTFLSKVRTELNENSAKLNSLNQTSVALNDKVKQSTLTSPVNGNVSRLYFNTIGGVIPPGKDIMEIVPSDDSLILETKVEIRDIAFVRPEQAAMVKLTAYDYTIYGGLEAVVDSVSADSIVDDKGNAYYVVKVRTLKNTIGKGLPIIPGMMAQVDIMTGKKTILSYLLKPVLRAKSYAFSER
jgi:membrane fusion protein, adhesin transport system